VRDISSVALNLIIYKLTYTLGLTVQMYMSLNGTNIFILIKGDDMILK